MSKYDKIISELLAFKKNNDTIESHDIVLIKSLVDSILSGKLALSKILKIEGSVWTCSKIVYHFINLDCDDKITKYLKLIMPPNKKEASKSCSEIWEKYNLGEEIPVRSNDKHNTILIKKKVCTVGVFIDFFEEKALAANIIDKKMINE
jgi:hypothetical protein